MKTKTNILKSTSLLLSFWMLVTSSGLSVDFHYCKGEIVDWSVFVKGVDFESVKEAKCCQSTNKEKKYNEEVAHLTKGSCCFSGGAEVIIESEFNSSSKGVELKAPQLLVVQTLVGTTIDFVEEKVSTLLFIDLPILRHKNRSLNQVFLL